MMFKEPPACERHDDCRIVSPGVGVKNPVSCDTFNRAGERLPTPDPVYNRFWKCTTCNVEWSEIVPSAR